MKQSKKLAKMKKHIPYNLLCLPGLISLILMHYVPISGITLAFKDYSFSKGIFGSDWVGFENFEFFFKSNDMVRILRNTIFYNIFWMLLVNIGLGLVVALLLYEVRNRLANKFYQTSMLIPAFISWVAVAYIVYIFLSKDTGLLNMLITSFGGEPVNWYGEAKYWPVILTLAAIWKDVGMASLYYYAALLSIDNSLFEAAAIDGAGRWRQVLTISLPECLPMMAMVLILRMGSVLGGGMDIFYQVPMNQGALYETTDTIATYLYRGLASANYSTSAAVGLFQSVVGVVLLLFTNSIIKKIDPDKSVL